MTDFVYQDLVYGNMRLHSEKRNGLFILQLIKNNVVVKEQTFVDWESYSRQYDSASTMFKMRAQTGY